MAFKGSVWARYLRTQQSLELQPGGGVIVHDRRFRIRWRAGRNRKHRPYQLQVTDDIGIIYNVDQLATGE